MTLRRRNDCAGCGKGVIAFEIWDDDHASSLSHSSVDIARTTGTLGELALALSARTPMLCFAATSPKPQPPSPKQCRWSRRPESARRPTER
jgi:hypothetical protein